MHKDARWLQDTINNLHLEVPDGLDLSKVNVMFHDEDGDDFLYNRLTGKVQLRFDAEGKPWVIFGVELVEVEHG